MPGFIALLGDYHGKHLERGSTALLAESNAMKIHLIVFMALVLSFMAMSTRTTVAMVARETFRE